MYWKYQFQGSNIRNMMRNSGAQIKIEGGQEKREEGGDRPVEHEKSEVGFSGLTGSCDFLNKFYCL